jgi:hypothetical protein
MEHHNLLMLPENFGYFQEASIIWKNFFSRICKRKYDLNITIETVATVFYLIFCFAKAASFSINNVDFWQLSISFLGVASRLP